MRAQCIVKAAPTFHDAPGFGERVENLAVKQLIPDGGVEAFDVAILPRAPRLDVGGLCTDGGNPILDGLGNKLRAIAPSE